jgi:hypothetical protein
MSLPERIIEKLPYPGILVHFLKSVLKFGQRSQNFSRVTDSLDSVAAKRRERTRHGSLQSDGKTAELTASPQITAESQTGGICSD